jgi:hypothetical protein
MSALGIIRRDGAGEEVRDRAVVEREVPLDAKRRERSGG